MLNRYDGKPFLMLLESYVLESIGELQDHERDLLAKMEPKLREIYGGDGNWTQIVAKAMSFPAELPTDIRHIWEQNRDKAKRFGQELDARDFARLFVDANFQEESRPR